MKNIKVILVALLVGAISFADAQYYPGPPGPPPPPPPSRHRERQQRQDPDEGTPPSGYFNFTFGLTNPVGSFASEFGTGYGGYALPGTNVSISLAMPINHSNFGVAFMYNAADNQFDMGTYMNNVQAANQNYYYGYDPNNTVSYDESFILGGLFFTYPIHRLSLDFRLLGGVAICDLPQVDYIAQATSSSAVANFEWDTPATESTGFAMDIGGDLRFKFRRVSLMLGIDYLTTAPVINAQQQYTDQTGYYSYNHVGGSVPISFMSYNLGLGWEIR